MTGTLQMFRGTHLSLLCVLSQVYISQHSKHSQGSDPNRVCLPSKPHWWNLAHFLGFSFWGITLLAVLYRPSITEIKLVGGYVNILPFCRGCCYIYQMWGRGPGMSHSWITLWTVPLPSLWDLNPLAPYLRGLKVTEKTPFHASSNPRQALMQSSATKL